MKAATSRIVTVMVCASGALINSPLTLADNFAGTLGTGNVNIEPTDVYALTCPIGTASVRARATTTQADQIVVQVINPNGLARTAVSLLTTRATPTAVLAGRAGNYLVTVHKSPTISPVSYNITLDCFNASIPAVAFLNNQSLLVQDQ